MIDRSRRSRGFSVSPFFSRTFSCDFRPLGRTHWTTQDHVHCRSLFQQRLYHFRFWRLVAPTLDHLSWLRDDWRLRALPGLHFPGFDSGEMVSRSPGYGDRHGHHGIWRRRLHRFESQFAAHGSFQIADSTGVAKIFWPWHHLFLLHGFRFAHRARAVRRLETGGYTRRPLAGFNHQRKMSRSTSAWRTPQFWMLWVVLCFNVTAGIGILEQASPMIQEMFPGKDYCACSRRLRCLTEPFQHGVRFVWASTERLHRP